MNISFKLNKSGSYPLLFILLLAHHTHAAGNIQPFASNGCSLLPDRHINNRELWRHCCIEHDKAYWQGGTWQQRLHAERPLKYSAAGLGATVIAELMRNDVRIGGSPFWTTQFHWGYGWDYLRGYKFVSDMEKQMVQKALHKHEGHHNNIKLNRLYNNNLDRFNRQYKG